MVKKISQETLLKFIIISFLMVTIYAIVAIIFQAVFHEEISPTVTTCYMAAWGGEPLLCAVIKIFKIRRGE